MDDAALRIEIAENQFQINGSARHVAMRRLGLDELPEGGSDVVTTDDRVIALVTWIGHLRAGTWPKGGIRPEPREVTAEDRALFAEWTQSFNGS